MYRPLRVLPLQVSHAQCSHVLAVFFHPAALPARPILFGLCPRFKDVQVFFGIGPVDFEIIQAVSGHGQQFIQDKVPHWMQELTIFLTGFKVSDLETGT